jgi:hypothetical protein
MTDRGTKIPATFWDATATVYMPGPDGVFDLAVRAGLPCRVQPVRGNTPQQVPSQSAALRALLWEPGYRLPAGCQVEIAGVRWTPLPGTETEMRDALGAVMYRRCYLMGEA